LSGWVPEGSLAGTSLRHHLALELVSGADFWCKLMFRASPGDLGGPGVDLRPKTQENLPKNFLPDCLQVPSKGCETNPSAKLTASLWIDRGPLGCVSDWGIYPRSLNSASPSWVPEGSLAKNFRAGSPKPKIDPETPLDRRGLPGTSPCTKNQSRRPILRPLRGTQKLPPDCLQVSSPKLCHR